MPTRNVVLTDHHARVIERLVKSGRYQNASEVMREGLRLVEQRDAADAAKLKALRAAAKMGFDALDNGDYVELTRDELPEFIARIGQEAARRSRST